MLTGQYPKPLERIERPLDPPENPLIPPDESGWFDPVSEEFVADEYAMDYIGDNWDLMPSRKIEELEGFLIRWMFEDWKRVEAE